MRAHYAGGGRGRGLGGKGAWGRGDTCPSRRGRTGPLKVRPRGNSITAERYPASERANSGFPAAYTHSGGALRGELVDTMGGNGSPE